MDLVELVSPCRRKMRLWMQFNVRALSIMLKALPSVPISQIIKTEYRTPMHLDIGTNVFASLRLLHLQATAMHIVVIFSMAQKM